MAAYAYTDPREQQSKTIGMIATVILHAIFIWALWFLVLMPPDPPLGYGGSGMQISLGEENMGGPSEIPVEDPAPPEPQPEPQPQPEDAVVTQESEEAPVVEEKKREKKTKEVVKPVEKKITKPVEQPRKVDERSLFRKKTKTSSDASGRGDGDVPGNEGRADGDPNGSPDGNGGQGNGGNGSGSGTGDGIGDGSGDGIGNYSLAGRKLSRRPSVEDNSRETGKVVVSIVVDRTGKVLKATPGQKGSTTLSPALLEKAKQAAMESKFSPKPDGPEEQYGTITFMFRFKP